MPRSRFYKSYNRSSAISDARPCLYRQLLARLLLSIATNTQQHQTVSWCALVSKLACSNLIYRESYATPLCTTQLFFVSLRDGGDDVAVSGTPLSKRRMASHWHSILMIPQSARCSERRMSRCTGVSDHLYNDVQVIS